MRSIAFLFLLILTALSVSAQNRPATQPAKPSASPQETVTDEKERFETAAAETDLAARITALSGFLEDFPETERRGRALGLISAARAELAGEKLRSGQREEGLGLLRLAVTEAPAPVPEELFLRVLIKIPETLFWGGEREAAVEIAGLLRDKIGGDARQMLGLAAFHLSIENAPAAIGLLERSLELDPASVAAHQTLGLAHRMNFDLEASIRAYSRAVELDPGSQTAKRNLADMLRANGRTAEALALYEEILAVDPADANARTGRILARFDAGQTAAAELEMRNYLVENPDNLPLLTGAAYSFAAKGDGEKAEDYARKALAVEPRYVWAYIALARAFLLRGEPVLAEQTLMTARQFGNFPTLRYELATARMAAGFYRDAAEELRESFTLSEGKLKTRLGGRLEKEAPDFVELLALERRSSIFQPAAAASPGEGERLKELLVFASKLDEPGATEEELAAAAERFVNGDDPMKTHRQIYAAGRLLDAKKALPKVLELTRAAVRGVEAALEVESPASAVLADELYETRQLASSRGEALIVPDVPRDTLSNILRGRIEELTGLALFRQEKGEEALVRLKRAVSVYPKDSAWSRSGYWRMGIIHEAAGRLEEALGNYIRGYSAEEKDEVKKLVIEALYKRINGSLAGLEERMNRKPTETTVAALFTKKEEAPKPETADTPTENEPETADTEPTPENEPETEPTPEAGPPAADAPEVSEPSDERPADVGTNDPNEPAAIVTETDEPVADEIDTDEPVAVVTETDEPAFVSEAGNNEPAAKPETDVSDETPAGSETAEIETDGTDEEPAADENATERERPVANFPENPLVSLEPVTTNAPPSEPETIETDAPVTTETGVEPAVPAESVETPVEVSEVEAVPADETPMEENSAGNETEPVTTEESSLVPITPVPVEREAVADGTSALRRSGRPVVIIEDNILKVRTVTQTPPPSAETQTPPPSAETIPANTDEPALNEEADAPAGPPARPPLNNDGVTLIDLGATRPRIVPPDRIRPLAEPATPAECRIELSQDVVSVARNSAGLGVLVGLENDPRIDQIRAVPSSPGDIEAVPDTGIGALSGRAFFLIRSVSDRAGEYKVTFLTPCGDREIPVTVR